MKIIFLSFSVLTGLFHLWFFALESYFWDKPLGLKTFHMTPEHAALTKTLAFNQGFYNGLFAVGLLWSLLASAPNVTVYILLCIVVAGVVGGLTVNPRIFLLQSVPALIALLAYYVLNLSGSL